MPHWFKDMLVVTYEELVPTYFSYNTLKTALGRAAIRGYGMKRVMHGGNGRQLLVDFDTLPNNVKAAIGDPRKSGHPLEHFYKTDVDAIEFYTNYTFDDNSYIKDDAQERYITNASVLRATILLKAAREQERLNKNGSLMGIMKTLAEDATSFNKILKAKYEIEHSLPENHRRFSDVLRKFINEGYPGLIHGNHKNDNASIANERLISLLNNMFADKVMKPTATEVFRQYDGFLSGYVEIINNDTAEIYDPKEFRKISKSFVLQYLNEWEHKAATHSVRSGDRQKEMSKFKTPHSLEHPKFAGSIISIDDRQPPFEYAKGFRMWFYNAIDLGSEAFTTWVYGKTKEGIILDFYRQMIRNYHEWGLNIPAELECESSLNSSFKNTFLKEGNLFQHVRIEANNARGKRIEAYYRPLRYGLEKKREGWLARPFAMSESNQSGGAQIPMIPYNELAEGCLLDIQTWNNMPHSIHKDKTRWEVFLENQNPNLKPTNYKAFLKDLGYKTETSCNVGIIKFNNREWLLGDNGEIYLGEKLINLMKEIEGRGVEVYWLDDNNGEVIKALVYQGDQLICEALPKPKYNRAKIEQTDKDVAAREIMSSYVATIEGFRKSQKKTLDSVTIIDNIPVTLNNKFQIKSLQPDAVKNDNTGEIMPEPNEEEWDLNNIKTSVNTPLKDRF